MSFFSNLFSSSQGAGYQPQTTPLLQTTDPNAISNAAVGTNNALGQQQSFLNALQGQNGIGNQSSVFNQLQGVANGTGPNPAQAQLAQATGANVANQASLAAGQRGASSNPALIARQAAQTGAATQQNAAGQAATLQANQSLGALGQLSGIAGQQVAQQSGALGTLQQNQLANQGQQLGAAGQLNQQNLSQQQGINSIQGTQALSNQGFQQGLVSSGLNALGGSVGSLTGGSGGIPSGTYGSGGAAAQPGGANFVGPLPEAHGGLIPKKSELQGQKMAAGGMPATPGVQAPSAPAIDPSQQMPTNGGGPQSRAGQSLNPGTSSGGGGPMAAVSKLAPLAAMFAKGGKVNAIVSPGEKSLRPQEAKAVASGKASPQAVGEMIPGQAKVRGDSLKNDTVPKKLEEGGVVIPRSVMQGGPDKQYAFVAAVMARQPSGKKAKEASPGLHKL